MAVLMHAVCHPCVFTWGDKWTPPHPDGYPKMSADFPGEAQAFVEKVYGAADPGAVPPGVRRRHPPEPAGLPVPLRRRGRHPVGRPRPRVRGRAGGRPRRVREELARRPTVYPIQCATKVVELPGKEEPVRCELQALKVGPYLFLTMPGEPFVEYGFRLEKAIADRAVPIVVGYANGDIGYICTAKAYKEGGYEPNNRRPGAGGRADHRRVAGAGRPGHRRRVRVVRPEPAGRPQALHPVNPDRDGEEVRATWLQVRAAAPLDGRRCRGPTSAG